MLTNPPIPYALVIRWPVGGIRTHLKYAREMLGPESHATAPVLISYENADTRLTVQSLGIEAAHDRSKGVHSLLALARRTFAVCCDPKIRVIHSQGFISSIASLPAALLLRKRHIVSVHDVITDQVISETSALSRAALGLALRLAFAVHAVGRDCAASIRRLPFMKHARNIVIIANGVDPRRFSSPAPYDLRGEIGLDSTTKLIGFFGRFHPQKGFTRLIEAVGLLKEKAPELKVHVVAAGSGGFVREYQSCVQAQGLTESFHFLPEVENPASLMRACDMIVMPSLWEAYPLLAAEVLMLGVPLIASDCIGLREVTENSPARCFPAQSTEALAQAIAAEVGSPTTRAAKAFEEEARARFDFTANAEKLNRLLYLAHSDRTLAEFRESAQ